MHVRHKRHPRRRLRGHHGRVEQAQERVSGAVEDARDAGEHVVESAQAQVRRHRRALVAAAVALAGAAAAVAVRAAGSMRRPGTAGP